MAVSEPEPKTVRHVTWKSFEMTAAQRPPNLHSVHGWWQRHSFHDKTKDLFKGLRSRPVSSMTLYYANVDADHLRSGADLREAIGLEHLFDMDEFSIQAERMIRAHKAAEKDPFAKNHPLSSRGNLFPVRKPDTHKDYFFASLNEIYPAWGSSIWCVGRRDPDHWTRRSLGSTLFLKSPIIL